jgi:hypothetical protein
MSEPTVSLPRLLAIAGDAETLWALDSWGQVWHYRGGRWSHVALPDDLATGPAPC